MKAFNLKVTIRNAKKNGVLSFAKLFGITLSFAVVLFASAYVYYETSFDKNVPDQKRIYRCVMQGKLDGRDADFAVTSPLMAAAMKEEVPEIEEVTRFKNKGSVKVDYNNNPFEAGQMIVADTNFFSFFGLPITSERNTIFTDPDDIAIAKSLAVAHFGSVENALNKIVKIQNEDCTITGVFEDIPSNFHIQTKLVKNIEDDNPDQVGWNAQNYYTYLKTKSTDINADELNFKLTKLVYTHDDNDLANAAEATTLEDLKFNAETYIFYNIEPLRKIHFSKHRFDPAVTASKIYVFGAIIISILVLLISSINFVNLTIANFSTRFKEIGIRKTTGARNNQIASQFITESVLFWIIGFSLAIVIYEVSYKYLAEYLGFEINISNLDLFKIIAVSFIVLIAFNLLTTLFPILFASGKKVLTLIKGERSSNQGLTVKNSFVFIQFVISALIILGTIVVQKQVNYLINRDRGYDKENIMTLVMWGTQYEKRQAFVDELKNFAPIKSISTCDSYLGNDPSMNGAFFETQEDQNFFHTSVFGVDDEFANTFDLKIIEGRFFDKEKQTDSETIILNETAAKEYQGEGELVGKNVLLDNGTFKVIGIVKDFNFRSLYHEIQPLILKRTENMGNVYIKVRNNQIPQVREFLQKEWEKFNTTEPLEFTFHDEVIANQYIKDQQAKKLLLFLSIVSILIACVGLYAISFFTIIRRTKEIGVRKVNGAKLGEIVTMLNFDFFKWVIAAFLIACPLAYFAMSMWLQNFAYQTQISWWVFALAGFVSIAVTFLTISWQSIKAANKNPVEALRYE